MKSAGPIERKVAYPTAVAAVLAGITEAAAFYHWFTPPPPALTAAIVAAVSGIAGWLAPHTSRLKPVTAAENSLLEYVPQASRRPGYTRRSRRSPPYLTETGGQTMTIRYADISNHQPSFMSLKGEQLVCAKASQGTSFTDPDYPAFKASAAAAGVFFFAYHFLDTSDPAAQAAHCHAITGSTPLMLDMEETTGSVPEIRHMAGFVDAYRKLGGVCWLLYLPQWYWQKIGRPPMDPVTRRGLLLVSSHYGDPYTDADTGAGWQPYGGITPTVWQYTTTHPVNGVPVDYNAFRGPVSDLVSLVSTGKRLQPPLHGKYAADGTLSIREVAHRAGTVVTKVWFATAVAKHAQGETMFGDLERDYLYVGDWDAKLKRGTVVFLP